MYVEVKKVSILIVAKKMLAVLVLMSCASYQVSFEVIAQGTDSGIPDDIALSSQQ